MAPKKHCRHTSITKFLHDNTDVVKKENIMSNKRVFGYIFHKASRVVTLYTADTLGDFYRGDPCVVFHEKDWVLFYGRVWKDLNDCRGMPLYISEFDGVVPNTRFRVVGDHSMKNDDEYVYIFCCKDKTKLRDPPRRLVEKEEHDKLYEMQFLFTWRDLDLLSGFFSAINKMFNWCNIHDGYKKIKVALFHPERCPRSDMYELPAPPIHYSHQKSG